MTPCRRRGFPLEQRGVICHVGKIAFAPAIVAATVAIVCPCSFMGKLVADHAFKLLLIEELHYAGRYRDCRVLKLRPVAKALGASFSIM